MSLYDEENPLLTRPRPFWEEEEPVVPVPVAPVAAPAAVPEGGWKSLEDIGPGVKLVEPAAPPAQVVPEGGWKTLEEIGPGVKPVPPAAPSNVSVPEGGFKSLSEIGPDVQLVQDTPKTADASKWDESDKQAWQNLPPNLKKVFLAESNERVVFDDLNTRRKAIADEEFKPPENWASLTAPQKTKLQEDFQRNKQAFLRGFDTEETQKGHGDVINRLRADVQPGADPFAAAAEEFGAHMRANLFSPTRGIWDIGSGIANTMSYAEAKARGIPPEETFLHEFATAAKEGTKELVGKRGDETVPQLLRGVGTSVSFIPAGMAAGPVGVALMGAASAFGDAYYETKEMARMQGREATEHEATERASFAALVGMSEGLPVMGALGRLGKPLGPAAAKLGKPVGDALMKLDKATGGLVGRVISIGKEGVEEFGQEYSQNTVQDAYDKLTGLTSKTWGEVVSHLPEGGMAGLTGILTGIFMNAGHAVTTRGRVPTTATLPAGAAAPGAVPPVTPSVTPPGVTPPVTPATPGAAPGAQPPPPVTYTPGQQVTGPVEGAAPGTVTSIEPDGKVLVDWQDGNPPQAMAPEHLEMVIEPDSAGKTVVTKVQADNQQVQQIAEEKATNLQASAAPKTADALKQVAQQSNTEASVTAAEFLRQAQVANNAPPLPEAPAATSAAPAAAAPAPVTGDERFAPPAVAAPAAAPAAQAPAPAAQAPTPSIVVGGQVFTGATHADAVQTAQAAVGPDAIRSAETGWVDPQTGQFSTHAIYDAHVALNTAMEQSGNNPEAPAVQQAQAQLAQAHARNAEVNSQIVRPGAEQVVPTGTIGQAAVVSSRPSQELATPLAGVKVMVQGVSPAGEPVVGVHNAAQALNEARNEKTVLTILLNCIT